VPNERDPAPASPTEIAIQTGIDTPGLDQVRGTLEEALLVSPRQADLEIRPGQSGAEGLAALPNAHEADPWDGP
jgi:hypothetical protein